MTTHDTPTIPPQGRVALMFTAIEGAMARWELNADAFAEAVNCHNRLLRECIRRNRGFEVKNSGGTFMVAFADPADAIRCALDIHRGFAADGPDRSVWDAVGGVKVRIGIHTGEPAFRNNDYFGPPVNRTARIADAGHGGMTLLSEATCRLLDAPSIGIGLEDCGIHRLKDLGVPERLFSVVAADRPGTTFPPLRTLEALPHNFPSQVSTFVGRRSELDELAHLLRGHNVQLVTMSGPGGTGKTRLAMQVAAERLQDYPGGVWFVDLAGTTDPNNVTSALALALHVPLSPGVDPIRQVVAFLRDRRSLLVLDNFEQVADAAPIVDEILRECRTLTCLVTSRELLHLAGEREFPVEPLTVPPADPENRQWNHYESVQLFIERCQGHQPDFELTDEAGPVVGEICRRLDGIPLAIELAAANMGDLSPAQLLERIGTSFDLLSGGAHELPERQRTLRSAIDWSYDLLSEDERTLFAQLAVFVGGLFIEAAEALCERFDTWDLVFSLRDKSLLKADEMNGQVRYHMLETLRAYALDKLEVCGIGAAIRAKHAEYYLRIAEQWAPKLGAGGEAPEGMRVFTTDIDNLRAGMDWSVTSAQDWVTIAYGKALARFLLMRGLIAECDQRLGVAIEAARREGDRKSVARLLNQRGLVAWQRSDIDTARPLFTESYALSKELGDRERMLVCLGNLGNLAWARSDFRKAREAWQEGLELAIATGEESYAAFLRDDLGILLSQQGEYAQAEEHFAASLQMHRHANNQEGVAFSLYNASDLYRRKGDAQQARGLVAESRRLFTSLGHRRGLALTGVRLATILLDDGQVDEAEAPAREALRIAQETGDRHCEMYALEVLARAQAALGDLPAASESFRASVALAREVGDRKHLADTLRDAGATMLSAGQSDRGILLLSVSARLYSDLGLADAGLVAALISNSAGKLGLDTVARLQQAALATTEESVDSYL